MTRGRSAAEWLTMANAVTALRLVLFGIGIGWLDRGLPGAAAIVLGLAWLGDALDGWLARRFNASTTFGSLFDKAADRLVIGGGALALLAYGLLPAAVLLVFLKDFLLLATLLQEKWRQAISSGLGRMGKLMTGLQGLGVAWLFLDLPYSFFVAAGIGAIGVGVAGMFFRKLMKAG